MTNLSGVAALAPCTPPPPAVSAAAVCPAVAGRHDRHGRQGVWYVDRDGKVRARVADRRRPGGVGLWGVGGVYG
jgi:hypothetical protein